MVAPPASPRRAKLEESLGIGKPYETDRRRTAQALVRLRHGDPAGPGNLLGVSRGEQAKTTHHGPCFLQRRFQLVDAVNPLGLRDLVVHGPLHCLGGLGPKLPGFVGPHALGYRAPLQQDRNGILEVSARIAVRGEATLFAGIIVDVARADRDAPCPDLADLILQSSRHGKSYTASFTA